MNEEFKTEELANRWIDLLRLKASEYEHTARKKGFVVSEPSLDDICNEMIAYFTALKTN